MNTGPAARLDRLARVAPAWIGLALCLAPYAARLKAPSLYADDVVRVAQLQTLSPGALLLAPFNEHLAPLFQLVSWLTWQLAGQSLARAPLAFTLASFAPFALMIGLLGHVLRRETGSGAAAMAGVAAFSLSWLAIECVYWYSASSFMWSLLLTLAGWSAARGHARTRGIACLIATAAAPAFSMIGLLAGPVAAFGALFDRGDDRRRARGVALACLGGTLLFLAVYLVGYSHGLVSTDRDPSPRILPGLLAASRAPAAALAPSVLGVHTLPIAGPSGMILSTLTLAAAVGLLVRAWRVPGERALTLGGLALIAGGYALTFCACAAGGTAGALLETQRYHLFPMLGLVFVLAPWLRSAFDRLGAGDGPRGLWAAAGLAALLLAVHLAEMQGRARFMRFPDQGRTLAALDDLGEICAASGVTRAEAIAALDPVETAWTPRGYPLFLMLGPCADTARVPDARVKATLLAALSPDRRRSLCGGMDATPYLRRGSEGRPGGRRVGRFRIRDDGAGRLIAAGWPSFLEFDMDEPNARNARALSLSLTADGGLVEVWWRGERGKWSETRSVRLHPPGRGDWLLPLERLPHWDPAEASRLRLLFHDAGPVAQAAPRWVR